MAGSIRVRRPIACQLPEPSLPFGSCAPPCATARSAAPSLAFLLFNTQEYAVWVAVAVYAFQQGGAGEAGAVLVLQLVPAALVAPVAAVLADRIPRSKALVLGYGLQTCATTLLGLSLVRAPAPVAYAAAVLAACCVTLTRPAHNAVLPRLADTPGELTAANAASSTMDGLGTLVGPLAGGAIMAWSGPGRCRARDGDRGRGLRVGRTRYQGIARRRGRPR